MSALAVTGSGTSTLTLAGTASRSLMGSSNVNMALALNNFIDVSGGNTPVASITLNTNPIASSSFNLTDGITVNAVVTPENPTNPALTWAVSGSGFTVTPSSDTKSAVVNSASTTGTRTVTCTAADGSGVNGTINVIATAQSLEANNDVISVSAGRTTGIDITANDVTHGGGCTVVIVQQPSVGTLTVTGQTVALTIGDVQSQNVEFTYKLTKTGFTESNTAEVTLVVGQN